jgi:hypothetical protein
VQLDSLAQAAASRTPHTQIQGKTLLVTLSLSLADILGHQDNLRRNVMDVQVALSRNMYGHSSIQSFELGSSDVQVRSSLLSLAPAFWRCLW